MWYSRTINDRLLIMREVGDIVIKCSYIFGAVSIDAVFK